MNIWRPRLVASAVGLVVAGVPGAVMGITAISVGPRLWRAHQVRRTRRELPVRLAAVMELGARAVRAGDAPTAALRSAADHVGDEVAMLIDALVVDAAGSSLASALRRWTEANEHPAVSVVAAAIGLVADGEGSAARAFEAAAVTLRDRDTAAKEIAAWAAQSRASATLLVAAPGVLALGALVIDPSSTYRMLANPLAVISIATGVALETAGAYWMARLVHRQGGWR